MKYRHYYLIKPYRYEPQDMETIDLWAEEGWKLIDSINVDNTMIILIFEKKA